MRLFSPGSILLLSSVSAAIALLPTLSLCSFVMMRVNDRPKAAAFRLGFIIALCIALASGVLVDHYAIEIHCWLR